MQSPCSCRPFHSMTTTDSVKRISNGLAKSLSEVLKPPTSSPIHVVLRQQPCACVSRPLRVQSPRDPGNPPQHAARGFRSGFRSGKRPVELPFAPDPGCTAQPRAHGSKYLLNPSSWDRAVPVSRLRLASCPESVLSCISTCSCPPTPSPRLLRSKVSTVDSRRAPARCSIRPAHRSKLQVAVCSRADASHSLFLRHTECRRAARRQRTHNAVSGV